MEDKKSSSTLSKIIVGVAITVISAIILASLGLGGGGNPTPNPNPPPQVEMGGWCCDTWGNRRCQLVSPVQVGSSCFCPGQGNGIVCK